jgi:hypothetical protein
MLDCPLDRYFPLIIGAIKEIRQMELSH